MFHLEDCFSLSQKIEHSENGDSHFVLSFSSNPAVKGNLSVFCVLDGISTQKAKYSSNIASRLISKKLLTLFEDIQKLSIMSQQEAMLYIYSVLKEAILSADARLCEEASPCGTTVSAAVLFDGCVYTANVGDSPIFAVDMRAKTITDLYTDHSEIADMARKGELSEKQALRHPKKSCITKAVGGRQILAETDIATKSFKLDKDCILLIGSDGALRVFERKKLLSICVKNENNMKLITDKLFACVKKHKGTDDFTVIAVRIKEI